MSPTMWRITCSVFWPPETRIVCTVSDIENWRHLSCRVSLHLLKEGLEVGALQKKKTMKKCKNRNQTSFPTWVSSPLRPRTWSQSLDRGCSLCSAPQQNPCQAPPPSEWQTQWRSTKLFWNLVGPLQNDALDVVLQKGIHLILIMWTQTTITNQNYSFWSKRNGGWTRGNTNSKMKSMELITKQLFNLFSLALSHSFLLIVDIGHTLLMAEWVFILDEPFYRHLCHLL